MKGVFKMTREEILKMYEVDNNGVIRSPGKFEGEMLYVPYLWNCILDGDGDIMDDSQGNMFIRLHIEPEDIEQFPELEGTETVDLYETEQGFVFAE